MHDLSPELPLSCIQFRIINSFCLVLAWLFPSSKLRIEIVLKNYITLLKNLNNISVNQC